MAPSLALAFSQRGDIERMEKVSVYQCVYVERYRILYEHREKILILTKVRAQV